MGNDGYTSRQGDASRNKKPKGNPVISTHIYNIEVTDAGPLGEEQRKRIVEILAEGIYASLKAEGKFDKESVCKQEDVGPLDKGMTDMYNYGCKVNTTNRRTYGKEDNHHSRRRPLLLSLGENSQDEEAKPQSYVGIPNTSLDREGSKEIEGKEAP